MESEWARLLVWTQCVGNRREITLKGHLRALPTEIISPAKRRSSRKWRPTNGPADRLATKFPKIQGLMSFALGCSYYWAGQHEPSSFSRAAPSTKTSFVLDFSSSLKLMDDWAAKVDQYLAYGGLWYFADCGKLLGIPTLGPVWQQVG